MKYLLAALLLLALPCAGQISNAKLANAKLANAAVPIPGGPNAIPVDFFIDFTNGTAAAKGTAVTLSIATNATHAFITGPWLYQAGNAPQSNTNMVLWTNNAQFFGANFFADGAWLNLTQTTNEWMLTNANYQFLTYTVPSPSATYSWFFIIRVTESGNSVGYDGPGVETGGFLNWSLWIDDPATGYWTSETGAGASSQHIAAVGYTNMYLYFTGMENTNLNQTLLFLYTNSQPDMSGAWYFVGSASNHAASLPGANGTLMDIGRPDVHGNVAATKFEYIAAGLDFNYAHFPLGPIPWTNAWAPVISALTTNPADVSCVVTWNTDHSANSGVNYGLTSAYGSNTRNATPVRSHSITLSGLTASTTYHYQVGSTNSVGLASVSADSTFTTTTTPACNTVGDSLTGANSGGDNIFTFHNYAAFPVTISSSYTICAVGLEFGKVGTGGTGNFDVSIYTDNSGSPGTLIGTGSGNIAKSSLTTDLATENKLAGTLSAAVTSGTRWIVVHSANTDGSNNLQLALMAFSGGNFKTSDDGTTWSANDSNTFWFKTYHQ